MNNIRWLHISRRITQVVFLLLIFLMPVFDILRYDTATKELFIFGQVWSLGLKSGFYNDPSIYGATYVAVHFFLKAILPWVIVLCIFPLFGVLLGRSFCGWLCPEGALFELADFLTLKTIGQRSLYKKKLNDPEIKKGNKFFYGILSGLFLLIVPPLTGAALTGYFIAPKIIWHQITTGNFTFGVKAGIIGVSIYMFVTSILVRHAFCKYVCAAGLMQMLFGWISPVSLRIKFDRENLSRCTDCKRCEKACFMDVKPRYPKKDINCVNCGECITACRKELGDKCLFSYSFGSNTICVEHKALSLKCQEASE
ncbi:4Fe-4S binding protein [Dissulfurispira thermophila]|nr:4Fe-4S binding protein [Dissulfurispira thermophila]